MMTITTYLTLLTRAAIKHHTSRPGALGRHTVKRLLYQFTALLVFPVSLLFSAQAAMAAASQSLPEVLTQNAIMSVKASGSAMLAVTHAGTRLIAVGERGIILVSDDAGKSWRQVATPVQVSLVAVQFITPQSGWAVGHMGVILHSADGGTSWQKQFDGVQAAAAMLATAQTPAQISAAQQMVDDGPDKPFLNVLFQNPSAGFVIGAYNMVFHTTDAGKTWQPWQDHVPNAKSFHLYGISASTARPIMYLAGEQGILFHSDDNGMTFTPMDSPYKGSYFGVLTTKTGEIIVYGLRGTAFWSGDTGGHWNQVHTHSELAIAAGLELNDGTLALLTQGGELLLSRDKGRTFERQPGAEGFPSAAMTQIDDTTLLIAGLRGMKRIALASQAKE